MLYRLIAKAPCRVEVNGRVQPFSANQSVLVRLNDRNRVMRGMHRDKFVDAGQVEEAEETQSAQSEEVVTLSDGDDVSSNYSEPDLSYPSTEDDEPKDGDERPVDQKLEELGLPNPALSQSEHWATVRKEVQKLEDQSPIPYDLVKAYKVKFSNYSKVVEECDRILNEKDNPHVE